VDNISTCTSRRYTMNTAVGLAVIGVLVVILLWSKMQEPAPAPAPVAAPEPPVVIEERPVYVYPTTYTSSPWRIPAYSYGSIYDYQRFHRPYVPISWSRPPLRLPGPRPYGPRYPFPSPVPRAAMGHPMRPWRPRGP
jgi:hypothetical protein